MYYFKFFLGVVFLLLGIVASFNWWFDPHFIFRQKNYDLQWYFIVFWEKTWKYRYFDCFTVRNPIVKMGSRFRSPVGARRPRFCKSKMWFGLLVFFLRLRYVHETAKNTVGCPGKSQLYFIYFLKATFNINCTR